MIALQFGQCGNQLGHAIFSKISSDIECANTGVSYNLNYQYSEETFNKWFTSISREGKHLARAILVDTEQKVISKICNETAQSWAYHNRNIVCQAGGGCANNWAYGYKIKGYDLCDVVLDTVRKEVERLDHFEGFLLLMSSAGGTGSGVGCRLTEHLHEEYKSKPFINSIVLPFSFGEVCTQNYNTLLTLAKLYDKTDVVTLFDNEQIHSMCTSLLDRKTANFKDLNDIIAKKLVAVFQPVNDPSYNPNTFVSRIASHPSYKFITIKSTPHMSSTTLEYEPLHNWQVYTHHLKQMLRVPSLDSASVDVEHKKPTSFLGNTNHHSYACSVSNILVTRGVTIEDNFLEDTALHKKDLYTDWNVSNQFSHYHQKRKLLGHDKFLALVTNNSQVCRPLDAFLKKTWNSYIHSAFLHQYKQFGLEEDDFLRSFGIIENVVEEYRSLEL